jgi:hypothetical protein
MTTTLITDCRAEVARMRELRAKGTQGKVEIVGAVELCVMGEDWAHFAVVSNPRSSKEDPLERPEPAWCTNSRFKEACANAALIADRVNGTEAECALIESLCGWYEQRPLVSIECLLSNWLRARGEK